MVKETLRHVNPRPARRCVPFRYFQSSHVDPPAENSADPIAAVPGPLVIVAVTVSPGATVVGLTENVRTCRRDSP